MITRDLKFGIGIHTTQLVKHLRNSGIEVDIYLGKGNYRTNTLVEKVSRKKTYDLIHVQGTPFGAFGIRIVPMVVTVHSLLRTELKYEKKLSYRLGIPFEEATLRKAKKIIAVSNVVKDELIQLYHVPEEKIVVIPNAIDVEEFDDDVDVKFPFVFSCGRNVKRKNFSVVKKACELLHVPYVIEHGSLSRKALIHTYKTASVFVMPSLYESFGMVVLEAMASKTPVIASDIPAMNGIVINYETGILFNPKNVEELKAKIDFVMSHSQLSESLSENAYNHVKRNFNWKKTINKTIKTYEEVIT